MGPGGGGTCDSLPVPPVPPASCTLAVTRTAPGALTCYISLTADYSLTTSASTSVPSATLSKSSNNLWIANNVACLATAFSGQASVIGPGGAGTCQSAQVPAVAAPACTLASASRVGNTSSCSVQVTTSGGPASSVSLTSPLAVTLSGSGTSWSSSNINCSQTSSSTFSARVTGPGGTVNCSNSLVVAPVTAPSCISLTVTRTTPSASTCNATLVADDSLTTSASTQGGAAPLNPTRFRHNTVVNTNKRLDMNLSWLSGDTSTVGYVLAYNNSTVVPPNCGLGTVVNLSNVTSYRYNRTFNGNPSAPQLYASFRLCSINSAGIVSEGIQMTCFSSSLGRIPGWPGWSCNGCLDAPGYGGTNCSR